MSTAFTTSLSGMLSSQFMLDITANNLANTETPGFKAGRADFATQLSALVDASQAPNGTVGGRNPEQVGQGVVASSVQRVFTQGGLNPTGRDLDLAIEGNGFFRLKIPDGTNREVYTRVGNFGFDGQQTLVDLTTGSQVLDTQGRTITPMTTAPPSATTGLTLTGNLAPKDAQPMHGTPLGSLLPIKDAAGNAPASTTLLSATSMVQNAPTGPVTLNLVGTMGDGTDIPATAVTIDSTETVGSFVLKLNAALVRPTANGSEAYAEVAYDHGSFTLTAKDGGGQLSLFMGEQAPPAATDAARNTWQYGTAADTFDWKRVRFMPSAVNTNLKVYTADGTQHTVAGKLINTGSSATQDRTWDLILEKPTTGSLAAGGDVLRGLTLDKAGRNVSGFAASTLNTTWSIGGASSVALDTAGLTGYQGDAYVDGEDSTGYPPGFLSSTTIDSEGRLTGFYSNNKTLVMENNGTPVQIGIVTFVNPAGLNSLSNNQYQVSDNSGTAAQVAPGENGTNKLTSGALEGSNVELSSEFSKLIVSQRGFQSNSKAFQIADQMLEAANGLIR